MHICRKTKSVNSLLRRFITHIVLDAHLPQKEFRQLTAQKVHEHCYAHLPRSKYLKNNSSIFSDPETFRRNLTIQRFAVIPLSTNRKPLTTFSWLRNTWTFCYNCLVVRKMVVLWRSVGCSGLIGWVPMSDTLHALIRDYRSAAAAVLLIDLRYTEYSTNCFLVPDLSLRKTNIVLLFQWLWRSRIRDHCSKLLPLVVTSSDVDPHVLLYGYAACVAIWIRVLEPHWTPSGFGSDRPPIMRIRIQIRLYVPVPYVLRWGGKVLTAKKSTD